MIHPFSLPLNPKRANYCFQLKHKIQIIALSIITTIGLLFLNLKEVSLIVGTTVFYTLSACRKWKILRDLNKNSDLLLNNKNKESTNIALNEESLIQTMQDLQLENLEEADYSIKTFFHQYLNPILNSFFVQLPHTNLCFIKDQTALFGVWFDNEYKVENHQAHTRENFQRQNLLDLRKNCPQIEEGLFVSIRGDGDCTIRSIGVGLIFQTLLKENGAIDKLIMDFQQIENHLGEQVNHLDQSIENMQIYILNLRKEIHTLNQTLEKNSEIYRIKKKENELETELNAEGANLKAELDDKEMLATLLESHLANLKKVHHQQQVNDLFKQLSQANQVLASFIHQIPKNLPKKDLIKCLIELMQSEEFDFQLIKFLRIISSLYMIFQLHQLGSYAKQLNNEEQVLLGELTVFDLIIQRANARQPNEEHLQGGVTEAASLSFLFQQPMSWFRCQVAFKNNEGSLLSFIKPEQSPEKNHLYILNRPGHSDLILA